MDRAKLLVATHNPGKLREYRGLLGNIPFELVSLDHLGIAEEVEETGSTFHENARLKASTYAALSGLLTLADDSGLEVDALGGDPGVHSARYGEEPPLNPLGTSTQPSPGSSPLPPSKKSPQPPFNKGGQGGLSDQDRVRLLLRNLEGVPWARRTARFRCVVAIATSPNPPLLKGGRGDLLPSRKQPVHEPHQVNGFDITLLVGSVAGMIQYDPVGQEGFGYDPVFYLPSYGLTMAQLPLQEKNRISHRANAAGKAVKVLSTLAIVYRSGYGNR